MLRPVRALHHHRRGGGRPLALLIIALAAPLALAACGVVDDVPDAGARTDARLDARTDASGAPDATPPIDAPAPPDAVAADAAPAADACVPACSGRACGSDGCGGACGACGAGQMCDGTGHCVAALPECPCWAGECNDCYCGHAVHDYAAAHNCQVAALAGHEGDLLSCTGGHWSAGTRCANGCNVAPPMQPDTCIAPPPPPGTHRLFVAWDASTAGCRGHDEAYFHCMLEHTQFNDMARAYSTGRALSFGATAVLGRACSYVHPTSATIADDARTMQCILDQTHWDVHDDDVVLYYPGGTGCVDGRNHWHIPVTGSAGGASIEAAYAFTGASCNCQTALGTHEVYEASARYDAADCCNGQDGCPATPAAFGWYTLHGCPGGDYTAQAISPAAHEFDARYCTTLTYR